MIAPFHVRDDIPARETRDKGPLLLLSQRFAAWLAAADVCLALTTYQAGRLFFIGRRDDGGIPAVKDELACRAFVVRTLERLGLNVEGVKPVGRPPDSVGWTPSET
jgi:hypothetical protein